FAWSNPALATARAAFAIYDVFHNQLPKLREAEQKYLQDVQNEEQCLGLSVPSPSTVQNAVAAASSLSAASNPAQQYDAALATLMTNVAQQEQLTAKIVQDIQTFQTQLTTITNLQAVGTLTVSDVITLQNALNLFNSDSEKLSQQPS